jgi:hypothetical protein
MDIRELRSLSLSIPSLSIVGPPIGVSRPESELSALKRFLRGSVGGSVSSTKVSLCLVFFRGQSRALPLASCLHVHAALQSPVSCWLP